MDYVIKNRSFHLQSNFSFTKYCRIYSKVGEKMLPRIISAIVGILMMGYLINAGGWRYLLSVMLLNLIAIYELHAAFKEIDIHTRLVPSCLIAIMLQLAVNFLSEYNFMFIPFSIVLMLIFIFTYSIINNGKNHIIDVSFTMFSFVYTTILFMYFLLARHLNNGVLIVWWIFVTTWLCDTGAFFIGLRFGRRKLVPNISPHKTIEGSIGGIIFSSLGSFLFTRILLSYVKPVDALLIGVIVGIFSQIGDLSASLIKRYCKIKDFSNIIPGHGGILDRFDSALFSFPVAYYYILFFIQGGGY